MSTVSGPINHGITLGAPNYASPLTVTSTGSVSNNGIGDAIYGVTGTVVNQGTLTASGVSVSGKYSGVHFKGVGSVDNSGIITSDAYGIYLSSGGVITNSGTIIGGTGVVFVAPSSAASGSTLFDSGTIIGTGGVAVSFSSSNDALIFQPGNVLIQGTVDGGGGTNTLEFASAASIGTLTGVGASFTNFGTGTVDKGAGWVLAGSVTLAAGVTLTDKGTLTDSGSLSNAGLLSGGAGTNGGAAGGAGSNGITLSSGSLNNTGTVAGGAGGAGGRGNGYGGGHGGTAVKLTSGTISNSGLIAGGVGGAGGPVGNGAVFSGGGGNGGIAVTIAAGSLLNTGTITGGSGGAGGSGDVGGSGGNGAVGVALTTGLISNSGLIVGGAGANGGGGYAGDSGAGGYGSAGVAIAGGSLVNTATIVGGAGGNGSATGAAAGAGGLGVRLAAGSLTNSGTISGGAGGAGGTGGANGAGGIGVYVSVTTLTNNGTILGGDGGIGSGATASGGGGVSFKSGGTLIDSGFIAGGNGGSANAVTFGAAASKLVLDPGASFNGAVVARASFTNVLELASAASAGTLTGFGAEYVNFAQITIDAAASWTLTGANYFAAGTTLTNTGTLTVSDTTLVDAGSLVNDGSIVMDPSTLTLADLTGTGEVFIGADGTLVTQGTVAAGETIDFDSQSGWLALTPADFSGEIVGFFSGDTIDLTGITDANSPSIINGNTLQIEDGGSPILLTLDPNQDYTGVTFTIGTDSSSNHYNTVTTDLACFAEGTRLDTPGGPVAVEALRAGDYVLTVDGTPRKVHWIGWRRLDLRRHPDPAAAQPVRVLADAVAAGEPRCDVRLSPSHALLLGGVLIPVGLLVNGATIRREEACRSVTYFHVELEMHDVLLAEGLAAESYLDTGNRGMFENADAPLTLHPDLSARNDQARRESESCAPFVAGAGEVEPVWYELAERARWLGHVLPAVATTDDPELRLQIDGKALNPVMVRDGCYVFELPETAGSLRLTSRAMVPDALRPWVGDGDCRSLGVSVRRLTVRHGDGVEVIPLDHPCLRDGWWALERDGARHARWTNGSAELPLAFRGPAILEVEIAALDAYLVTEAVAEPPLRTQRQA